jgi:hypothetical protein
LVPYAGKNTDGSQYFYDVIAYVYAYIWKRFKSKRVNICERREYLAIEVGTSIDE